MNVTRTNKSEAPAPDAAPDPKAVEAIGRALEAHYSALVQAPLPDKFVELLARLEVGTPVSDPQRRRDALG
jgi:Anti-sigma factor NepR